jgi:hypothetical protein
MWEYEDVLKKWLQRLLHQSSSAAVCLSSQTKLFGPVVALLACLSSNLPCAMAADIPAQLSSKGGASKGVPSAWDHAVWDQLLKTHVVVLREGQATKVDYQAFAAQRAALKRYLDALGQVRTETFDSWSKAEQLAFLINAYNAWTVELILTQYPDLESIKDLGSWFRSPWAKAFIPLLGESRSLDDIEHQLIRGSGRYNEPRIHFAVNCASIGCPALRAEAYTAANLDAQLADQASQFLMDRSRNRPTDEGLVLSSIFKWYRDDFEQGWRGIDQLETFLVGQSTALGLSAEQVAQLQSKTLPLQYDDYDWRLNDIVR